MFQGYLKIQYEVYKWLQKKHPDKKVVINSPQGTPSQLYCDAVFLEIDTTPVHNANHDAFKAFNTACTEGMYSGIKFSSAPTVAEMSKIEKTYKNRLMVSLSLGASYCAYAPNAIPYSAESIADWQYDGYLPFLYTIPTELTDFSARTSAIPLITDGKVLSTNSSEVVGSVWADRKKLMLAIYNNDDSTDQIELLVNRDILEKLGQVLPLNSSSKSPLKFTFTVIDADCKVTRNEAVFDWKLDKPHLKFQGTLAKGCLLLIERQ